MIAATENNAMRTIPSIPAQAATAMNSRRPLAPGLLCLGLIMGLGLGGCKTVDQLSQAVKDGASMISAPPSAAGVASAVNSPPISANLDSKGRPIVDEQLLARLYQKRRVNGIDLLFELTAIRTDAAKLTSGAGLISLSDLSGAQAGAAPGKPQDFTATFKTAAVETALSALEYGLDSIIASSGAKPALDGYLAQLIEARDALASEYIELPSGDGLSAVQKRRFVRMGAMLIALRVSNKQLKQAQQDFANIEADYLRLIERREQAAGLLYSFLQQGPGPKSGFDAADSAFLKSKQASLPIKDFSNDMGVQNLALRYLRQQDPAAYNDYRSSADGTTKRTSAYIRTMVGGAAFGALVNGFGRDVIKIYKGKQAAELMAALSLVVDYGLEVKTGVNLAWDVSSQGIFPDVGKAIRPARFRVVQGEQSSEVGSSKEVFGQLAKSNAQQHFKDALFRDGAVGLLYRVYLCDRAEAGRMLDAVVPNDKREQAARDYLPGAQTKDFSFADAFEAPGSSPREREFGDALLRRDHRRFSDDKSGALALIQQSAQARPEVWNNDQLMRLIFANREGAAIHATLQVGKVAVRPVPSMQSIYAYEAQVDGCKSVVTASQGETKPAGKP
jgi:hypothetical protein